MIVQNLLGLGRAALGDALKWAKQRKARTLIRALGAACACALGATCATLPHTRDPLAYEHGSADCPCEPVSLV